MYSINLKAQYDLQGIFIGPTIGMYPEQSIRLQMDQQWKWVRQEYAIQVNIRGEVNVHAKMGFGVNTKRWDVFGYLPYLNYNLDTMNYNTPLSFEFFYKKRRTREWYDKPWFPYITLCFDVYRDKMIAMIRFKYRILKID